MNRRTRRIGAAGTCIGLKRGPPLHRAMMRLRRPSRADLLAFAQDQHGVPFSYPEVGSAIGDLPSDLPGHYTIDRYGTDLGVGQEVYDRARQALLEWRHCDLGWVTVVAAEPLPRAGGDLAVHVHVPPVHHLNGGRITVCHEESLPGGGRRLRLGYGTLATHAEQGEERFEVSLDAATGRVRYDVVAFSRPRLAAARLFASWTRRLQRRFARDTCQAMREAVREARAGPGGAGPSASG